MFSTNTDLSGAADNNAPTNDDRDDTTEDTDGMIHQQTMIGMIQLRIQTEFDHISFAC